MKAIIAAAGWIFFAVLVGHFFAGHGSRWTAGRDGMPRSLVAKDGVHYQDGSAIDEWTLEGIKADREEEFYLALVIVSGVTLGVWAWKLRKAYQRSLWREERRLRELYGPKG